MIRSIDIKILEKTNKFCRWFGPIYFVIKTDKLKNRFHNDTWKVTIHSEDQLFSQTIYAVMRTEYYFHKL